ncbi:S-adenosylmethionine-dependent methyltransferase domain protein [Leptospira borgpetersenii serovar Javanica str. UI 09931]|uniref:S-adenosylmethionine-dependent methyltransferase domain protein n=4 Tax=Leptospira borgpetersenii TaxID=174 RepID=A0A0S2IUE8_LEPBO|nr:S-adenosylmethionine-dependent methyltransferase domain protein [Leptospira borgpetersenii serovar Ballum]ANH01645.2 S-adenosylmethionine-dependent methyltransferase domain protein [Leptospira borgpetersenii str. 4E]AXX15214.1 SAM-dependent methyltransferase [Leptospira borgpetersenii serovar Ceylonica]EKP14418.1 S-adenosylmethionine-dependent methyltransferase domain protein [Leptospira borgpetersenii str. 200801926]EKQ93528.1 S-adenosylmethionine-dependent methyltransferase domain protein 
MTNFRFRRYQLNRKSELSIRRKHPWIFSGNLSSATSSFVNGQWLSLFSTENLPVATGIYSNIGLVAIRVIQFSPSFSKEKIRESLIHALQKRNELRKTTNAYRILHGENDFFPGVTIDRLNSTWVVRIYSSSLLGYGRWLVWNLYDICKNPKLGEPQPKRILFDPAEKIGDDKFVLRRHNSGEISTTYLSSEFGIPNSPQSFTPFTPNLKTDFSEPLRDPVLSDFPPTSENAVLLKSNLSDTTKRIGERLWRGKCEPIKMKIDPTKNNRNSVKRNDKSEKKTLRIRETIQLYGIRFPVELPGQKGGIFLDLRNLRKFLLENKKLSKDKNCLHLFSHTGLTSICMEVAGATSVLSVDGSKQALDSFQRVLSLKKNTSCCKHSFIQKNLFQELEDILRNKTFGLIVIDPPNLTPDAKSRKNAFRSYSYLFGSCLASLETAGTIILCSCSGRIRSKELESLAQDILKAKGWTFERFTSLKPEADHPIRKNFPEGNYFKVHIYENCKKNRTSAIKN